MLQIKSVHPVLFAMPSVYEIFLGPENRSVTMKLIRYSLAMFTAPVAVFFFFLHVVFGSSKDMVGWCGVAAVVMANLVIAAYVVMAWNEKEVEGEDPPDAAAKLRSRNPKTYRVD